MIPPPQLLEGILLRLSMAANEIFITYGFSHVDVYLLVLSNILGKLTINL